MPCPECGTATAPGGHFCHNCGRALEIPTEGLRVGDRRIVTALFADLVGYTKLVDELDPEEVRVRVDAALGIMGQYAWVMLYVRYLPGISKAPSTVSTIGQPSSAAKRIVDSTHVCAISPMTISLRRARVKATYNKR